MRQMSDNFKVRGKVTTCSFLFAHILLRFAREFIWAKKDRRERNTPSLEGRLDAKVFYIHIALHHSRFPLFFVSTGCPIHVLKAGNRNWPTDVSRECNRHHGMVRKHLRVSAVNISIVNERREVRPARMPRSKIVSG